MKIIEKISELVSEKMRKYNKILEKQKELENEIFELREEMETWKRIISRRCEKIDEWEEKFFEKIGNANLGFGNRVIDITGEIKLK